MSKFENPESENDFLADDDYLIGEDLRELESQLTADATFLHATYPSSSSKSERLAKLINDCVSASNRNGDGTHVVEEDSNAVVELNQQRDAVSQRTLASGSTLVAWQNIGFGNIGFGNIGLGIIASACLLICLVWYLPRQSDPGDGSIAKSAMTIQDVDAGIEVTPVSMSLPVEFLNATQPELEAMYDNMCPECDNFGNDPAQYQHVDF